MKSSYEEKSTDRTRLYLQTNSRALYIKSISDSYICLHPGVTQMVIGTIYNEELPYLVPFYGSVTISTE